MSRRPTIKRTFTLVILFLLCSSCTKQPAGPPKKTREQLIAQLLDKAEHTSLATRQTAHAAYRFAAFYAPQDSQIQAKFAEAKKMPVGVILNGQNARDFLADWVRHEDMRGFPSRTAESDLINLQMLNDERLVGDLSYAVYSVSKRTLFATFPPADTGEDNGDQVCVFVSESSYQIDEIRKAYGEPTVPATNPSVLTYGRMRVIASDSGKVKAVLFPLFPK